MQLFQDVYTGLKPIVKWAGGKERELVQIHRFLPDEFADYYEPFVGGGSVYMSINAEHLYINDLSSELAGLYRAIATDDVGFYALAQTIVSVWRAMNELDEPLPFLMNLFLGLRSGRVKPATVKTIISGYVDENKGLFELPGLEDFGESGLVFRRELKQNLTRKLMRMSVLERQKGTLPDADITLNIRTAMLSALYMYLREAYNKSRRKGMDSRTIALFLFIRNYAYSGMFRYNADGDFNVPYGGIGYNDKDLQKKLNYYRKPEVRAHFNSTSIYNLDFEVFLKRHTPRKDDFMFLDPPYDSDFSTYAENEFTEEDQRRLARYLLNDCLCRWMMIIKSTPLIEELYADKGLHIYSFDKKYQVSFMNRNNRNTTHLLITNYQPEV